MTADQKGKQPMHPAEQHARNAFGSLGEAGTHSVHAFRKGLITWGVGLPLLFGGETALAEVESVNSWGSNFALDAGINSVAFIGGLWLIHKIAKGRSSEHVEKVRGHLRDAGESTREATRHATRQALVTTHQMGLWHMDDTHVHVKLPGQDGQPGRTLFKIKHKQS